MTWKTKLKITGPSGSSLNFDGELTTAQKDAVIAALDLPGCTIGKSSAEPFGYFKAEPFGWTDCAETDEGARPLFDIATVQAVEKQRDELLAVFQAVIAEMEHRDRNDGNAPGHGHNIPGVWDSDNGDLAGKPCAWCAVWKKAKEICADGVKGGAA